MTERSQPWRFNKKKYFAIAAGLAASGWYVALAAKKITLVTADLGRHLANGAWVMKDPRVLSTNFYSYTAPDFPFVNHHWGTGLVFHWVRGAVGFEGLSVFFLLIGLLTLWTVADASARRNGWFSTLCALLFAIPLVTIRSEIRPEVFSYFFCAVFFGILTQWREGGGNRPLFLLPAMLIFWVNLHIYFIFGLAIIGCFALEEALKARHTGQSSRLRSLSAVSALCLLATLVNPEGWRLAVTPFLIFRNYGYRIAENQSVVFFLKRGALLGEVIPYGVVTALVISGTLATVWVFRKGPPLSWTLVSALFLAMGFAAIRNIPLAGLFSIPLLAEILKSFEASRWSKRALQGLAAAWVLAGLAFNIACAGNLAPGIGLMDHVNASAEFFKTQGLRGPIFNNYDIGSYLIYHLFPDERVFVDNRPEAYPDRFFTEVYVPMQEDENRWKAAEARYGFNAIYFFWHDQTPWAQKFLVTRVQDPEWVPVYIDPYALILLKNNDQNHGLIERFQLPRSMFTTATH